MFIGNLVINDDKTSVGWVTKKDARYDIWHVSWCHNEILTYHYTQEIKEMRRKLKSYMEK